MYKWSPLVHKVYRDLRQQLQLFPQKQLTVLVSGGRDSMALLQLLAKLRQPLGLTIHALHFHHGPTDDATQKLFRDQALSLVATFCEAHHFELKTILYSGAELSSEAAMRSWRRSHLVQMENEGAKFVTGHHLDDLLETRLIRLVRGTGLSGLAAMEKWGAVWRPLLDVSSKEIGVFAQTHKIEWLEDPSNATSQYFRNWMRNEWLPSLENQNPGGCARLAQSLQQIVDTKQDQSTGLVLFTGDTVLECLRAKYQTLRPEQKRQGIHGCLRVLSSQYTSNHVNEIFKRLDSSRRRLTFEVARTRWTVEPHMIRVESTS